MGLGWVDWDWRMGKSESHFGFFIRESSSEVRFADIAWTRCGRRDGCDGNRVVWDERVGLGEGRPDQGARDSKDSDQDYQAAGAARGAGTAGSDAERA